MNRSFVTETFSRLSRSFVLLALLSPFAIGARAQALPTAPANKTVWKSVPFAILKYNDEAPKSWAMYHPEKRGSLLVRVGHRYLLINLTDQEVFDIDPLTVKEQNTGAEWTVPASPDTPVEISEWKERNVGSLERIRFRFGKNGHFLELQIPLRPDGKSYY